MASSTRAAIRYRCGVEKCRTRFRHKKRLKREPKCPACGDTIRVRDIEAERLRELAKQERCECNWYPFPHRAGTLTMCELNPDRAAGIEPTAEDISDYQACLDTPRSGFC